MKSMSKGQERRKEAFLLVAFAPLNMNFPAFKHDRTKNWICQVFINQAFIQITSLNVENGYYFKLDLFLASIDDFLHIFHAVKILYVAVLTFESET